MIDPKDLTIVLLCHQIIEPGRGEYWNQCHHVIRYEVLYRHDHIKMDTHPGGFDIRAIVETPCLHTPGDPHECVKAEAQMIAEATKTLDNVTAHLAPVIEKLIAEELSTQGGA